jgi:hypothetical protein
MKKKSERESVSPALPVRKNAILRKIKKCGEP